MFVFPTSFVSSGANYFSPLCVATTINMVDAQDFGQREWAIVNSKWI
jgi:hypothetical protein